MMVSYLSNDFATLVSLEEIHNLAGTSFNVASPKQLGEILFEKMGLEGGKNQRRVRIQRAPRF